MPGYLGAYLMVGVIIYIDAAIWMDSQIPGICKVSVTSLSFREIDAIKYFQLSKYVPWQQGTALHKSKRMKQLSPILWTKNLQETILFYESVLGFKGKSNFPNFVALRREAVEIMFIVPQDEPEECKDPKNKEEFFPKPVLTGSIFIVTDEVDKLWESIRDKATIKSEINNREYLMRDFSILDNNGYELVFGQDIS